MGFHCIRPPWSSHPEGLLELEAYLVPAERHGALASSRVPKSHLHTQCHPRPHAVPPQAVMYLLSKAAPGSGALSVDCYRKIMLWYMVEVQQQVRHMLALRGSYMGEARKDIEWCPEVWRRTVTSEGLQVLSILYGPRGR